MGSFANREFRKIPEIEALRNGLRKLKGNGRDASNARGADVVPAHARGQAPLRREAIGQVRKGRIFVGELARQAGERRVVGRIEGIGAEDWRQIRITDRIKAGRDDRLPEPHAGELADSPDRYA